MTETSANSPVDQWAAPEDALSGGVPSWMRLPPTEYPSPPVEGLAAELPVRELPWESFERLCLRLLTHDAEVLSAAAVGDDGSSTPLVRPFGLRGQYQGGIDLYARDPLIGRQPRQPERPHTCLQARRTEQVTRQKLESTVDHFVAGPWAKTTHRFIYGTTAAALSNATTLGIETQAERLARDEIVFEVWDADELSRRLRELPQLVHEFFGSHWVRRFCGDDDANNLRHRLDVAQVAALRRQLREFYSVSFRVADPGVMLASGGLSGAASLTDRFVTPDLAMSTVAAHGSEESSRSSDITSDPRLYLEAVLSEESRQARRWSEDWSSASVESDRNPGGQVGAEDRTSADSWIGTTTRQVIVGEPGAGKSTLLRYLVLDLLSDEPAWVDVASRWGHRLPIWLPFHFYTQRAAGQTGHAASLTSALKAWFEQHDVSELWPLVDAALADDRLLLVVDGLDEWVDSGTGQVCAAALETFVGTRSAAVIVSTRPYGLNRLTLGADWAVGRVVSLSRDQQHTLAKRHFAIASGEDLDAARRTEAERSADALMADLDAAPDLREMGGVPLFFVLLVRLRIAHGGRLPERRFDLYEDAVRLLIADQPQRRRSAAAVTARSHQLSDRQTRKLMAEVAFRCQERGDLASIAMDSLRRDLADAMRDPDGLAATPAVAASEADRLVDVAEGELGLLVRTSPESLGFVHRVLQEQLAAEHAATALTPDHLDRLFEQRAGDPAWYEVIMSVLWRLERPTEVRRLAAIVAERIDETPVGLRAREMLAELVLGQFGLPGSDVNEYLPAIVDTIETHPFGPHRARLLDRLLAGARSPTTGPTVVELIGRWSLAPKSPTRDLVWQISALSYHPTISTQVCDLLVSALQIPNHDVSHAAGIGIAARCAPDGPAGGDERERLREGLRQTLVDPGTGASSVAALMALALEWRDDEHTEDLLRRARNSRHLASRLVAIADALGVLDSTFRQGGTAGVPVPRDPLSDEELSWVRTLLEREVTLEANHALLVAVISEVVRGDAEIRQGLIRFLDHGSGPTLDLRWGVALRGFGTDPQVVEVIARQLREMDHPWPLLGMAMRHGNQLVATYAVGSEMNGPIADAVEHRLTRIDTRHHDVELHALAAIDRGPEMRQALLEHLDESSFPHWRASALAEFWADDEEIVSRLTARLLGEPVAASQVAGIAPQLLGPDVAVDRLLAILSALADVSSQRERPDIVATALVGATKELDRPKADIEDIASRALGTLLPRREDGALDSLFRHVEDAIFQIAAGFSTTSAALAALDELAGDPRHPVEPFLFAYRSQPQRAAPFLKASATIVRSLPATQRARLCRHLAERAPDPMMVLGALARWPEEVVDTNRSIVSLAYHRALLAARTQGLVDDTQWTQALEELRSEARAYGPSLEARRRAAWVGMCVLGDWSPLAGLVERIGDESPVTVGVSDPLHGPDAVLLHQVAANWGSLRARFGADLLDRLSGRIGSSHSPWGALALVAAQSPELEADLKAAVEASPQLLNEDGIFVWLASQASTRDEFVTAHQLKQLRANSNLRSAATRLLSSSTRIDLPISTIEAAIGEDLAIEAPFGDDLVELLAARAPDHPKVIAAWDECRRLVDPTHPEFGNEEAARDIHPLTYLAIGYAAIESERIVWLLDRDHGWLSASGSTHFDSAFASHVIRRLRRDPIAAEQVRQALLSRGTSVELAAMMAPLYASSVPTDSEVESSLLGLADGELAQPMATLTRDHSIEAVSSARMAFIRALELGQA